MGMDVGMDSVGSNMRLATNYTFDGSVEGFKRGKLEIRMWSFGKAAQLDWYNSSGAA